MSRLEFSATRLEGREIDVRDRIDVEVRHPVREIDDYMGDIIYNAIDYIQERANDNELRIHYFNMMSANGYRNSDFKDLVLMIGDVLDIGVSNGTFREVRDGIVRAVEDIIQLHIGYTTEQFPDLARYISRNNERSIDRAISEFDKYQQAIEIYRRNGNRVPSGDRYSRGNDDRYRDSDTDRGVNYGEGREGIRDRSRSPRRDRWERGAIRDGVHGSRSGGRRPINTEGRFGNTDQDDRFDDTVTKVTVDNSDDRRGGGNRNDDRDERDDRSRNDDRFANTQTGEARKIDVRRTQRLPGDTKPNDDVSDALARNDSTEGKNTMSNVSDVALSAPINPLVPAFSNLDMWLPTKDHPHPLALNHTQDLFFEIDLVGKRVIPHTVKKENIVDYHAHASMAFGDTPRDFRRFEDGGVERRLNTMHEALMKPTEEVAVPDSDETVTYHNCLKNLSQGACFSIKEILLELSCERFAMEQKQHNGITNHPVELAVGEGIVVESFAATQEEYDLLAELREEKSFVKLCEKLRALAKKIRPELFLLLDRYLTKATNRMLRQYMSIPKTKISSFTSDWLDLFALITKNYGEAYRDAIVQNQEREIRQLLAYSKEAEALVASGKPETTNVKPFVIGVATKVFYINEVSFNLNLDLMPDVASQLMPETNPFFHDLAQDLLTKDAKEYSRFFIQTSDMRVFEASRSYLNDRAVLLRVIQ